MAIRQTGNQAKSKAEVKTGVTNNPVRNSERKPQPRNPRSRSRSVGARSDRADTLAAAPQAGSGNGGIVQNKPGRARPRSKPAAERTDLRAVTASSPEPRASTKRAQLIGMLERPEGASVAEIGQRLGWLPHTVRAAITGLRKAGREVTRNKDADDRSVYRLAPPAPAGEH
jgi:Protein of unknown function (DUF3489)